MVVAMRRSAQPGGEAILRRVADIRQHGRDVGTDLTLRFRLRRQQDNQLGLEARPQRRQGAEATGVIVPPQGLQHAPRRRLVGQYDIARLIGPQQGLVLDEGQQARIVADHIDTAVKGRDGRGAGAIAQPRRKIGQGSRIHTHGAASRT